MAHQRMDLAQRLRKVLSRSQPGRGLPEGISPLLLGPAVVRVSQRLEAGEELLQAGRGLLLSKRALAGPFPDPRPAVQLRVEVSVQAAAQRLVQRVGGQADEE